MDLRRYAISIEAPPKRVWATMLEDATYRAWTQPFCEGGSHFVGDWSQGSEMRFLGTDPETGHLGGMFSRIQEHRPWDFVSIQHLGMIMNGEIDTASDMAKPWAQCFENYSFTAQGQGTELVVDLQLPEGFGAYFDETWPAALQQLKALAEA